MSFTLRHPKFTDVVKEVETQDEVNAHTTAGWVIDNQAPAPAEIPNPTQQAAPGNVTTQPSAPADGSSTSPALSPAPAPTPSTADTGVSPATV